MNDCSTQTLFSASASTVTSCTLLHESQSIAATLFSFIRRYPYLMPPSVGTAADTGAGLRGMCMSVFPIQQLRCVLSVHDAGFVGPRFTLQQTGFMPNLKRNAKERRAKSKTKGDRLTRY